MHCIIFLYKDLRHLYSKIREHPRLIIFFFPKLLPVNQNLIAFLDEVSVVSKTT